MHQRKEFWDLFGGWGNSGHRFRIPELCDGILGAQKYSSLFRPPAPPNTQIGAKAVSAAKTAEFDFGRKHFQSGVKWCPIAFRESRLSIQHTTVRGSLSTYSLN